TVDLDYDELGTIVTYADALEATTYLASWESIGGTFSKISIADFKTDLTASLGLLYQPLDADLTAIAALAGTGIARRTASDTWTVGTTVSVAEGGTGAVTHTVHGVLLGQGTSAITTLNGTVGNSSLPLISQGDGLDPIYSQITTAAISGLGAGVADFLGTPSSANLATAVTGETGSGALVFGTGPTIDGAILTGVLDAGGATSFEIPNDTAPTVNANGEIAVDTSVADFSHGVLKYYGGEEMGVVAMPIAEFTSPTNGAVPTYNSTTDEFEMAVPAGGGGEVTAAANIADNRLVRGDGGVKGIQESVITVSDTTGALSRTGGIAIEGTNTNDAAAAGYIGELIGSTIASGSAVSLTTATNANVTSISLTAGDWDVWGAITYNHGGSTNVTTHLSSISN
ncbi:MAG: hypothetical protein Q8N51_14890, partial [Gammaproteobacteria bacterium]|nr:hypothetical protein [Gammaproteobacteria bacterium]